MNLSASSPSHGVKKLVDGCQTIAPPTFSAKQEDKQRKKAFTSNLLLLVYEIYFLTHVKVFV